MRRRVASRVSDTRFTFCLAARVEMAVQSIFDESAMLGSAISDRVRAAARRFTRANDGNVAVIFTLAILPIFAFVGAAIDYTRANTARTAMQAALDSTALMLSKDLTM